jgi:pimeloyl-ACP methyl ester carboxylesterase
MKSNLIISSILAVFVQRGVGNPLVARQDDAKSVWDFKEVSPQLGTRRQRLTYNRSSPRVQILFGFHVTKICMCRCGTIITQSEILTCNSTCALLEVPLDYSDESVGTVNLGIIKLPGDTEDAQEVLLNPGGPGGSSIDFVLGGYEAVQAKIGTQYSLVGIDPRGVKNSGPSSDCFEGYPYVARNAFLANVYTPADITSDYDLRQTHGYMNAYGKWCSSVYAVNNTARYAGTVATAQDMLHYIELRAKSKGEPPEEAKLWYYGISYGTILGGTFASLFPDRIGRMTIDGVMDLEDHFNGGWEKSIVDNDEASRFFFKRCFEAGPALCKFHQNATCWEELEERYNDILENLKQAPIPVGDLAIATQSMETTGFPIPPSLFRWQDLVNAMFGASYLLSTAINSALDEGLVELQARAGSGIVQATAMASILSLFPEYDERMARSLINCLDANRRFNTSEFPQYKSFVEQLYNTSVYGGLNTAYQSGPICSHLDISPPESQVFDGMFAYHGTKLRSNNSQGVPRVPSTSVPILLVSTLWDPVTPLPAAKKMQSLFPGSGLLVANNSGVRKLPSKWT